MSTHNLQVVIEITKQITDRESRYGACFANVRAAELVYKSAICAESEVAAGATYEKTRKKECRRQNIRLNNQNPKPFKWTKKAEEILNHCKGLKETAH